MKPSEKLVQMGILSKQQMDDLRSEFTNSPKKPRLSKKSKKWMNFALCGGTAFNGVAQTYEMIWFEI